MAIIHFHLSLIGAGEMHHSGSDPLPTPVGA